MLSVDRVLGLSKAALSAKWDAASVTLQAVLCGTEVLLHVERPLPRAEVLRGRLAIYDSRKTPFASTNRVE
jgi:hypothetical protein